jgi:hypothetical protein
MSWGCWLGHLNFLSARSGNIIPWHLGADEAGVEGAGEGDVGCALNEAAAVGKEREAMRRALEAEKKIVEPDGSVGLEAVTHGGKVDRAMVLVDLDGVATAEGDVRTPLTGQVGEDALAADGAGGVGFGCIDFAALVAPKIVTQESAAHEVWLVGEEFQGFGGLDGGGKIDRSGEDARSVAGLHRAGWGLRKDAGEAGRGFRVQGPGFSRRFLCDPGVELWALNPVLWTLPWEDVHRGGVGADGCCVDPGFSLLYGVVVNEVPGFEVVGGVEDQVCGAQEFVDVGGDQIGDVGVDCDGGVEESDLAASGLGLRQGVAGVSLVEEDLALQVGGFHEVTIDEGEGADTGSSQERCGGSSCGSNANDGDVGVREELLASLADSGEENLPGVAVLIRSVALNRRGCGHTRRCLRN